LMREKTMNMVYKYKDSITVWSVYRDEAFSRFVRIFFLTTLYTLFAFRNSTLCECCYQFLRTRKN
ncbi:MAG: hypothetical protein VW948_07735, partial [Burkholderiaceae bacterium]